MFPFHLAEFSDKKKQWKVHVAALVSVWLCISHLLLSNGLPQFHWFELQYLFIIWQIWVGQELEELTWVVVTSSLMRLWSRCQPELQSPEVWLEQEDLLLVWLLHLVVSSLFPTLWVSSGCYVIFMIGQLTYSKVRNSGSTKEVLISWSPPKMYRIYLLIIQISTIT